MRPRLETKHTCNESSPAMPPSIIDQNRNNPDFQDFLHGSYEGEVVLEREEDERDQYRKAQVHHLPMNSQNMQPHGHDVLMGRGGKNNQWCGNEKLRTMARSQAENYRLSSKKGKSYISRELVKRVRELDPPGRFLKKCDDGQWEDVGDEVAREKASQVLRDAVAVGMNSYTDASESELEKDMETMSEKQNRSVSAPPVMAISRRRRRGWDGQEPPSTRPQQEEYPTPVRSMSSLPHHYQQQPMYHSSSKRRRYYDTAWMTYEQENHPPLHSGMYHPYASHHRYPAQQHTGYPTQQPRYPTQQASYRSVDQQPPPRTEPADDFDLFNGELLRSDTESPDIETSGSF